MRCLITFLFIVSIAFSGDVLFQIDFEDDTIGKFPRNWASKDEKNMLLVYKVLEEDGNRFLHATSKNNSIQIGYDREWELREFPKLKWRWRPIELPKGTNERIKAGNDNVLGVYIVFGGFPVPKTIKYIWSETLPVGTVLESPFTSKTKMVVVRSGVTGLGEWHEEERNVLDDYRRLFGEESAKPTAKGIAVLTDSDNTTTRAIGDYDDFTITK